MYKVFFKESSFLLIDNEACNKNNAGIFHHLSLETTRDYIFKLLESDKTFHVTLLHPDIDRLFSDFRSLFRVVGAAGGIVEKTDKILAIKRLGLYDLPKGHIEPGEDIEDCAIREVEEECGVTGLKIKSALTETWHIYYRDNEWQLKHTWWFTMTCPSGQQLVPQTEEDIESVFWIKKSDIPSLLPGTYASLRPVFRQVSNG